MASMISDRQAGNGAVLVLGASGKLGGMLRGFWQGPQRLICHSRIAQPDFVTYDLLDEPAKAVASMRGAQAVICLSGVTPARAAQDTSAMTLNIDLAQAAVTLAYQAGVSRVFVASSAAVYGTSDKVLSEDDVCTPVSDYGRAKLEMEQVACTQGQALGQPVTALRIGNVAGADAILGGWTPSMHLDQFADGRTPQRSYIGPATLTRILSTLCQAPSLPEVINIAAPGATEMGALLDAAQLTWVPRPAQLGAIAKVALCTRSLERYVDFRPRDSTAEGMVSEWRMFRAQE